MPAPSAHDDFGQLTPRYLGPVGNRVSAIAGVAGDHLVYYAGAAAGGIFKTTDGGTTWKAVFDRQAAALPGRPQPAKVSSIGALAVSASDPNVVWAGTGESWIRGPISIGNGVYRSVDGGDSWTHVGLDETGRISKIVIHPADPDVAWAAALGSCYAPSPWRGLFKTTDGGETWRRVLRAAGDADEETGCSDVVLDPNNPAVLYAGLWQFKLRSWIRVSGGPGGGVFKSVDGGETWRELTAGLPTADHVVGKVSVGVAASDSSYVYASIETGDGVRKPGFENPGNGQFFQSTDGGECWTLKSYNRNINSRAAYYTRHVVSPDNKHEVYTLAPELGTTTDGGETFTFQGYPQAPGVDHHDAWIDPADGDRIAVASDFGVGISQNRGRTWAKISLPIAQMYNVAVDREVPYNVFGNCQDKLATWGPSNARIDYNLGQGDLDVGKISRGLWITGGPTGECGYSIPDPKYPDLVWSSGSSDGPNGGTIALINRQSGHWRLVTVAPRFTTGTAPEDLEYRFHWHLPMAVSQNDLGGRRLVYAGSQLVHATGDEFGQSWHPISPELTGRDDRFLQSSGGLTTDNINVRMAYTTSAIAESPVEPGLLWVGTGDQRLWLGSKGEGEWEWRWREIDLGDVVRRGELPAPEPGAWALVSCIVPSRHDAGVAYVAFDRHQADDPAPYVFKTTDRGESWRKITGGIPASVVSYVHWLAEDTERPGLLFAGTENALYVSFDDGGRWQPLPGVPPAPISGLVVQEHFSDLVVSTFGRGFFIYDDITPLRQLADVGDREVYLFEMPRPIYRFQDIIEPEAVPHDNDPTVGSDPRSPAPINFYLRRPAESATLTIKSEAGETVRTIEISPASCGQAPQLVAGINRHWWNLQSNGTEIIKLRTNPPNQKDVEYCPNGIRPYSSPVVGTSLTWLVPPGAYSVELEAEIDGETHRAQPRQIRVLPDPTERPDLAGEPEKLLREIREQTELIQAICRDLSQVALDINAIEFVCFQIQQLAACDGGEPWVDSPEARRLLCGLDRQLREIEDGLLQRNITGQGEDLARFPAQLVENLVYLGTTVAGAGDFRPTDEQAARGAELAAEVAERHAAWEACKREIEEKVNPELRRLGVPVLLVDPPDSQPCPEVFQSGPAF